MKLAGLAVHLMFKLNRNTDKCRKRFVAIDYTTYMKLSNLKIKSSETLKMLYKDIVIDTCMLFRLQWIKRKLLRFKINT